jgi:hypothetical protein
MVSQNYLGSGMVTNTSVNVLVSISSSRLASVKIMLQLIHFLLVVKFLLNLLCLSSRLVLVFPLFRLLLSDIIQHENLIGLYKYHNKKISLRTFMVHFE